MPLEDRRWRREVVGRGGRDGGDPGTHPAQILDRLGRAGRAHAEHERDLAADLTDRHVHHGIGDVGRKRRELGGRAEDEDRVHVAEEPSELPLERRPVEGAVRTQRRDQRWDGSGDELHG